MSMLVARMEKRNTQHIGGIQKHNQREFKNHSNQDIDTSLSHLNYDLVNKENIDYRNRIMDTINSQRTSTKKIRKDAVLLTEWIITSDQSFFEELSKEDQKKFFAYATQWFQKIYGKQNITFATVHMDETTPHMHIGVIPIRNGKLQSKNIFNRQELLKIQEELPQYLRSKSFNIDRGNKGSKMKHLKVPEYKEMVQELEKIKEQKEKHTKELADIAQKLSKSSLKAFEIENNIKILSENKNVLERKISDSEAKIDIQEHKYETQQQIFKEIKNQEIEINKINANKQLSKFTKKPTGLVELKEEDFQQLKKLIVPNNTYKLENKHLEKENQLLKKQNKELKNKQEQMTLEFIEKTKELQKIKKLEEENYNLIKENSILNKKLTSFNKFLNHFNLKNKFIEFKKKIKLQQIKKININSEID